MDNIISLCGVITAAATLAVLYAMFCWAKRITEGARCQLRSDMLRTYYHHREQETIRQYEYENFVMEYEAYRALGGNSFMEKIYGEVRKWEVVT